MDLSMLFSNLGPSYRIEVHWTYRPQKLRVENRDKIQDRRDNLACIHPVAADHSICCIPPDEVTNLEYGTHSTIIGKDSRPNGCSAPVPQALQVQTRPEAKYFLLIAIRS